MKIYKTFIRQNSFIHNITLKTWNSLNSDSKNVKSVNDIDFKVSVDHEFSPSQHTYG